MKNDKGWLYLPVEVKVRELDAKLLLAYFAAIEGYHVIIGEHRMVELASNMYPKGIFFSKGYPSNFRKRIITNAKKNGHAVVELDEEGLLLNDKDQYLLDRMRTDMLDYVTQEYCWGNFQKDIITKTNPKFKQRCYVVGNPRFDLLMPKFNVLYTKETEHIKSKYGKFILINTRFPRYNALTGIKKTNNDSPYFKKLYDSFLEVTKSLSRKFPDINFVIRPHPGENFESYRNALSDCKNVHVIHEGNVIKWLLAAEVIIHNGCTSSIEAFLLKKPVISYLPIPSNDQDNILPNQLGISATSIKEVHTLINRILDKKVLSTSNDQGQIKQGKNSLNRYYEWSNKKFAYETILHLLNTIPLPQIPKTFSKPNKFLYLKENKYVNYFFPPLPREEIQEFFKKMDDIEDRISQFSIKMIGRNLYEIHIK